MLEASDVPEDGSPRGRHEQDHANNQTTVREEKDHGIKDVCGYT
jgi:hypothetical protein